MGACERGDGGSPQELDEGLGAQYLGGRFMRRLCGVE